MSNGSHAMGTTAARIGASVIGGALGVVRRVRLPQRRPGGRPDTEGVFRRSFFKTTFFKKPDVFKSRLFKVLLAVVAVVILGRLVMMGSTWAQVSFTPANHCPSCRATPKP